jgi:hypothetical protein
MAHNGGDDDHDLPATWPFRAAGTILIGAMIWFTLGFGMHDTTGDELTGHIPVFLGLILAAVVLIVLGAAYNLGRDWRRNRHG